MTVSYTHELTSSISARSSSGYRSSAALSAGSWSLNAVLNMRMISELSLFTIILVCVSHRTGTVKLLAAAPQR